MRYLIQHRKEFAISCGFFIMAIINLIRAIRSGEVVQEVIVAVIYTAFGVLAWFFNMPTSKENSEHTGAMRLEKAQLAGDINGEDFFDEPQPDEDGEDLDEDELNTPDIDDGPEDGGEDE